MPEIDYIAQIRIDGAGRDRGGHGSARRCRFRRAGTGRWRDLARHMGRVHRWATVAAGQRRRPEAATSRTHPTRRRAGRLDPRRVAALLDSLVEARSRRRRPGIPSPSTGGRGLAPPPGHELSIHRWDAQDAIGRPSRSKPVMASNGIDEYFEVALPRLVSRESSTSPSHEPSRPLHRRRRRMDGTGGRGGVG